MLVSELQTVANRCGTLHRIGSATAVNNDTDSSTWPPRPWPAPTVLLQQPLMQPYLKCSAEAATDVRDVRPKEIPASVPPTFGSTGTLTYTP